RIEVAGAKRRVPEERTHAGCCMSDRGGRRLDADHVAKTGDDELFEKRAVPRSNVERSVAVAELEPREEARVREACQSRLVGRVERRLLVGAFERLAGGCRARVE